MRARLVLPTVLEAGRVFEGVSFGASPETRGEAILQTGLDPIRFPEDGQRFRTRALTRHIRTRGAVRAILTTVDTPFEGEFFYGEAALRKAAVQLSILSVPTLTGANATVAGKTRGRSASKFTVYAPSENAA